jgi:hypothetical protein
MINGVSVGGVERLVTPFPRPGQADKPEGSDAIGFLIALDFGKADTDASGDVTLAELSGGSASGAEAESLFNSIDANEDGRVTEVEMIDFVTRVYEQFRIVAQEGPVMGGDALIEIDGAAFGIAPDGPTDAVDAAASGGAADAGAAAADDTMSESEQAFMVAVEDRKKRPPIRDRDEDEGEIDSQTSSQDALRRRESIIDMETERLKNQAESAYLGLRAIGEADERTVDAAA